MRLQTSRIYIVNPLLFPPPFCLLSHSAYENEILEMIELPATDILSRKNYSNTVIKIVTNLNLKQYILLENRGKC
jgi:hypothetical protein